MTPLPAAADPSIASATGDEPPGRNRPLVTGPSILESADAHELGTPRNLPGLNRILNRSGRGPPPLKEHCRGPVPALAQETWLPVGHDRASYLAEEAGCESRWPALERCGWARVWSGPAVRLPGVLSVDTSASRHGHPRVPVASDGDVLVPPAGHEKDADRRSPEQDTHETRQCPSRGTRRPSARHLTTSHKGALTMGLAMERKEQSTFLLCAKRSTFLYTSVGGHSGGGPVPAR